MNAICLGSAEKISNSFVNQFNFGTKNSSMIAGNTESIEDHKSTKKKFSGKWNISLRDIPVVSASKTGHSRTKNPPPRSKLIHLLQEMS